MAVRSTLLVLFVILLGAARAIQLQARNVRGHTSLVAAAKNISAPYVNFSSEGKTKENASSEINDMHRELLERQGKIAEEAEVPASMATMTNMSQTEEVQLALRQIQAYPPEAVAPYREELKRIFTDGRNLKGFFDAVDDSPSTRQMFTVMKATFPELVELSRKARTSSSGAARNPQRAQQPTMAFLSHELTMRNPGLLAADSLRSSRSAYDPVKSAQEMVDDVDKKLKEHQEEVKVKLAPLEAKVAKAKQEIGSQREKVKKSCQTYEKFEACLQKMNEQDLAETTGKKIAKKIIGKGVSKITSLLTGGILKLGLSEETFESMGLGTMSKEKCWSQNMGSTMSSCPKTQLEAEQMIKFKCSGNPEVPCKGRTPGCVGWIDGEGDLPKCTARKNPEVKELTCAVEAHEAALLELSIENGKLLQYEILLQEERADRVLVMESFQEDIDELARKAKRVAELAKQTFAHYMVTHGFKLPTEEQAAQLELNRKARAALDECRNAPSCRECQSFYDGDNKKAQEAAIDHLNAGQAKLSQAANGVSEIDTCMAKAKECKDDIPNREWWFENEFGGSCWDEIQTRNNNHQSGMCWWFWNWGHCIWWDNRVKDCEYSEWRIQDGKYCVVKNEDRAAALPGLIVEWTLAGRKEVDEWQPIVESFSAAKDDACNKKDGCRSHGKCCFAGQLYASGIFESGSHCLSGDHQAWRFCTSAQPSEPQDCD